MEVARVATEHLERAEREDVFSALQGGNEAYTALAIKQKSEAFELD